MLSQYTIIEDSGNIDTYRFWTHFFSQADLSNMLEAQQFRNIEFREDILPASDLWNEDNVVFTKGVK
ncbi:MAG: hypothetical protein HRU41_41735 [Saprospiraceae bacterium]|nr:hypothetical protein [Saprospiraceae bacterium]